MKNNIAPIVIFSFNRPKKIKKLFKSLKKNRLSKLSKIYIFQDNFRFKKDKKSVLQNIRFFKPGKRLDNNIIEKKDYAIKKFYERSHQLMTYKNLGMDIYKSETNEVQSYSMNDILCK